MPNSEDPSELLIRRAQGGDDSATQELLAMHRHRLRRMIGVRLDPRLAARVDPSDVVQEALIEASRKMTDYLRTRPISFYPWLRQIAWERLVHLHSRHIDVQKRSVGREARWSASLSDQSVMQLAKMLATPGSSPSAHLAAQEQREKVRSALDELPERDREVLTLRYLEQLSTGEIAEVVGTSKEAVKARHFRAVQRLQDIFRDAR
jgi:RNA polymerase sigma-70 factor (ECF subfamily)